MDAPSHALGIPGDLVPRFRFHLVDLARMSDQTRGRRDVHDRPAAGITHERPGDLHAEHRPGEVDREHALPFAHRDAVKWRAAHDARIVHEHMQLAVHAP